MLSLETLRGDLGLVEQRSNTQQAIHVTVTKEDFPARLFTAVYYVCGAFPAPWLLMADFNDFANMEEKKSFREGMNPTAAVCFRRIWMIVGFSTLVAAEFLSLGPMKDRPGYIKIDTDGASRGNPGPSSFGCLARDQGGAWIRGCWRRLGSMGCLEAELTGILRGLQMVKRMGIQGPILETDSTMALHLLAMEHIEHHPLRTIIQDCKRLVEQTAAELNHVLKEGNSCAHILTVVALHPDEADMNEMGTPPGVGGFLRMDMAGAQYQRHLM